MAFDAGTILAKMAIDISQWQKSAKQINESQKKIANQTKKTGSAFKGMWKQVAVGMGVTNLVTSGIRGLMRQVSDTIRTGRDFEKEWANVTTMLNISRTATEKMKHELRMLSPTLGDTTELAKGMYQVLSASIEPAKAIKFLGVAAMSAKAGVTETKVAVDAMTTVINAYGMEAEKATEVSDIMFGIVKRGKVTYEELAHSLGTVIPIAATVGVKFRDVGAAVATLTRQGVQASKATMQLRQVMMLILGPSTEAMEIMDDLEISYGKNALEAKGLAGWLEELKEKTKGNADVMRKIVPNARALTGVLALVGRASKSYAYDQEFLTEVMGFTDEAFRKQAESIDFWIETAEVAADKIKIAFYEGLVGSLRESIRTMDDFDEKVTQATNNAANAVSLHVGAMVEIFGKLKAEVNRQIWPLLALKDMIIGTTRSTDELAEAEERMRESLARAGIEQITSTELTYRAATAALTLTDRFGVLARAADLLDTKWETQIVDMKELMDNMIGVGDDADLMAYEWEKSMSSMEEDTLNFMASIIPGMAFMTESITKDTETMAEKTKLTTTDMAMTVGHVLTAIAGQSKGLAIVGAIISTYASAAKTLQTYGWPLAIPFMAAAIAAGLKQVSMIKKQVIPKAEKGAYLPSPAIIEAGHGPKGEVVLPLDKAPGGIGGMSPTYHFNFKIHALDAIDVDRWFRDVGAKQIEEIFRRNQGGITEKSEQYLSQYRR